MDDNTGIDDDLSGAKAGRTGPPNAAIWRSLEPLLGETALHHLKGAKGAGVVVCHTALRRGPGEHQYFVVFTSNHTAPGIRIRPLFDVRSNLRPIQVRLC